MKKSIQLLGGRKIPKFPAGRRPQWALRRAACSAALPVEPLWELSGAPEEETPEKEQLLVLPPGRCSGA